MILCQVFNLFICSSSCSEFCKVSLSCPETIELVSDPLKKFTCSLEEEGSFISIEGSLWVKIFIKSSLFLLPPNFRGFIGLNKGFSCFVSFSYLLLFSFLAL